MLALAELPAKEIIGPLADLLLEEPSSEIQAACLDLLEKMGAVVSLEGVRTDGWLERLEEGVGNFDAVGKIVGQRFLAYAIILGVQIRTLSMDPRFPANTTVEFSAGDDEPETLTLGEFRTRLVNALLSRTHEPPPLTLPLLADGAAGIIGSRLLLLAPLFGISLEMAVAASLDEDRPRALLGFVDESGFSFMDLRDFEMNVKEKARRDLAGTAEEPFRLDLAAVERARAAARRGDYDQVISTLETWPGLLSLLQRTPVAQQLDNAQVATIGEGLELLGLAFKMRGRLVWAEELFRLGLQFVREGSSAARLFLGLGALMVETERYGEAIGLLRRSAALGLPDAEVFPPLARAFLKRGKVVAAVALLEAVREAGQATQETEADLAEAHAVLEAAGVTWNVPSPGAEG
jgi:hypothetical protein